MRSIETEVLVVGGGATGTGILRDLAMRGIPSVLVERDDLGQGTTGRYHGLLHSGGRYVVKDPEAARECIEENRILRRIMPFCIEDVGGFFVLTDQDDPAYAERFLEGCLNTGVPVEELSISQMLKEEPRLNPRALRCFRVPDGAADSFLAADANAESARQYSATALNYHEVKTLIEEGGRVVGAQVYDREKGEDFLIRAGLVINASGAWAGEIAGSVGIPVQIIPGKGTMIAFNHRMVNTVINRCKLPADGDILVPIHTVSVMGTTDIAVSDPDEISIEPWEVNLMLTEGDILVPGLKDMRVLRAWAGVRPLYKETQVEDTRDVTRAFILLDHSERDGVEGIITITSGKWTTYRKMAEVTVDLACRKLGIERECRTHLEALPQPYADREASYAGVESKKPSPKGYHFLGAPLAAVEAEKAYGTLICECELATRKDVENAIHEGKVKTIDDIRRDARLGMGPCQGGFCTYRAAGMLHELRNNDIAATNAALRDFLQERWKGILPILWGQQLRQERLDELIYRNILNADHLPGPKGTPLHARPYAHPSTPPDQGLPEDEETTTAEEKASPVRGAYDVVIIGAGLAGLTAAWQASEQGLKVKVVSKGWGSLYWNAGCIDVLGYYPFPESSEPVMSPREALQALIRDNPEHPYAITGTRGIEEAIHALQKLCAEAGYPMHGSLENNWLLTGGLGVPRPTCLAPETMISGDMRKKDSALIIGFESFVDFYPQLIAGNLAAHGIPARGIRLAIPLLEERRFLSARILAWFLDSPQGRAELARHIHPNLGGAQRVGLPAVLGLDRPIEALHDLEAKLGVPVFEIPILPPSIPGIRLMNILIQALEKNGGRIYEGMEAVGAEGKDGTLRTVWSEAAARRKANNAAQFVLATGGILGGGLFTNYDGRVDEVVCRLPVTAPNSRLDWFHQEFLAPDPHPIARSGLRVDSELHPIERDGTVPWRNLHAVGNILAGAAPIRERSLEGIAVATGFRAGQILAVTEKGELS